MEEYNEFLKPYEYVLKSLMVKIESLELDKSIHNIQSRLKSYESIEEKLLRRNFSSGLESARENLTDIAGIRIICYFKEDVYLIKELFDRFSDVIIIKERDYVINPKSNGYRSLHIIVEVPVFLYEDKEYFPVEIQIRTIAMDFWASMEHRIAYKENSDKKTNVYEELLKYSKQLSNIEEKLYEIL